MSNEDGTMSAKDQIDFRARDLYELQPGSGVTDFTKLSADEQLKWYRLASAGLIEESNGSIDITPHHSEPVVVQKMATADPYVVIIAILTLAAGAFLAFMAYHAVMKNGDIFTWNDILGALFLFAMVDRLKDALELKQVKIKTKKKK